MNVTNFIDDLTRFGLCKNSVLNDLSRAGEEFNQNTNNNLAVIAFIRHLKPQLILRISNVVAEGRDYLHDMLDSVGIQANIVSSASPQILNAGSLDRLKELVRTHGVRPSMILLENNANTPDFGMVIMAARDLLTDNGVLIGVHPCSLFRDSVVQAMVRECRLDVTMGSDYWFCTMDRTAKPFFPCQLAGSWETFKFASMHDDLVPVNAKDVFMVLTKAGIPCRYSINGGQPIKHTLPTIYQKDAFEIEYSPPYQPNDATDGGFIGYLKDIRVEGLHGYLYTRHDTLYEESLAGPYAHRHMEPVRNGLQGYEPTVNFAEADLTGGRRQVNSVLLQREVVVEEDVVFVNFPHLECYEHWLYCLLPRFWYLDEFPELAELPIVMTPLHCKYEIEYLNMLGIGDKYRFIFHDKSMALRLKKAYFPTQVERPHHTEPVVNWLRSKFLSHAAPVPEGYEDGLYYLTRKGAVSRGVVEEPQILDYVGAYGFKALAWTDFSVKEQIALAANARAVIGPHGSNFSNLAFARPGCSLLEVVGKWRGINGPQWHAFTIEDLGGKSYQMIVDAANPLVHICMADLTVDMGLFKQAFHQMMDELPR